MALRWISRIALVLLGAAVLAYPADFLVWLLRGRPVAAITMNHYTVAELKSGKEDWYIDGQADVSCSRSLLPESGSGACWWLGRHKDVIDRY